ncbi:MAG: hypothetical protein P8L78_06750 [Mariniblastus sp.]|nr:hypothetical protein [Mariniblastus sp.]
MQSRQILKQFYCGVAVLSAVVTLLAGCNQTGVDQPGAESKTARVKKLPKMKFHRPDSFPTAIARLGEIHQVIISDSPLPEPKMFQVVEVIHGSGPGAHSHYHLASAPVDHSHGHSDDHADEKSNEKNHEVNVDVITEMADIVKWLPDIAADTDMNKDSWSSVKTESESLHSKLDEALSNAADQQAQRKAIQGMEKELLAFTGVMDVIAKEVSNSDQKNQGSPEE